MQHLDDVIRVVYVRAWVLGHILEVVRRSQQPWRPRSIAIIAIHFVGIHFAVTIGVNEEVGVRMVVIDDAGSHGCRRVFLQRHVHHLAQSFNLKRYAFFLVTIAIIVGELIACSKHTFFGILDFAMALLQVAASTSKPWVM